MPAWRISRSTRLRPTAAPSAEHAARRGCAATRRPAVRRAWISRMRSVSRSSSRARADGGRACPGVKARAADVEHAAHRLDRVLGLLRRDEPEDHHRVSLSLAKKAAAFFRISRSSVRIRFSRRSRRSSSRSSRGQALGLALIDVELTRPVAQRLRRDTRAPRRAAGTDRPLRPQQPDRLTAELQRIRRVLASTDILPARPDGPADQVSTKPGELHSWYPGQRDRGCRRRDCRMRRTSDEGCSRHNSGGAYARETTDLPPSRRRRRGGQHPGCV